MTREPTELSKPLRLRPNRFLVVDSPFPLSVSLVCTNKTSPPPGLVLSLLLYKYDQTLIMRVSCNGYRILRKGCSDNCTIRPCLSWITSPESQANATRPSQPHQCSPTTPWRSCVQIAVVRGERGRCQAAVDAVLAGSEIKDVVAYFDLQVENKLTIPDCAIRQVAKYSDVDKGGVSKVTEGRARFRMSGEGKVIKPKAQVGSIDSDTLESLNLEQGRESSESESTFSGETVEPSLVNRDTEPDQGLMRMEPMKPRLIGNSLLDKAIINKQRQQ